MVTHTQPAPTRTAAPATEAGLTFRPNVDICDRGTEVVMVADVPGAGVGRIDVGFDDGVLTVHAAVPPRPLPGRAVRHRRLPPLVPYRRGLRRLADLGGVPAGRAHDPRPAAGGRAAPEDRGAHGVKPPRVFERRFVFPLPI
jgi:hypothetical protein